MRIRRIRQTDWPLLSHEHLLSVCGRRGPAKLYLAEDERERNGRKRDHRQGPEHVNVSEECRLRLQLLSDPGKGLLLGLCERAAVSRKIIHEVLERFLVLRRRRIGEFNEAALVELLAMREYIIGERDAD